MTERTSHAAFMTPDGQLQSWCGFPPDIWNTVFQTPDCRHTLKALDFSAELCSETADYNLDCPSDITLWINGMEAGTWAGPSDFGGRRGKLNPDWWEDKNTQYGNLKTWHIDEKGTYLDGRLVNKQNLHNYALAEVLYISVRIGIKEDAVHVGGVNIFGSSFGDYPQDLVMRLKF